MFKDEFYNLLTDKENFETAFEISQQMSEVTERLKKEFWNLVSKKLETRCEKTDWTSFSDDSDIGLYLKQWEDGLGEYGMLFCIWYGDLYDKLCYGLYMDERNKKRKHDFKKINEYVQKDTIMKDWDAYDDNYYKQTLYDFRELSTLKRILSDNKEEFATRLANELFEFAEEIKDDVIKMSKMLKK